MLKFLIVGLPRSRTAWLSAFISQSGTYCHHEAINGCFSAGEYADKVSGCGDSTTAFSYLKEAIDLNGVKILIIKKSCTEFNKCAAWCLKEYGKDIASELSKDNEALSTIDGLIVQQSYINDNLKEIWKHLVDAPWHDRYANISKLNISVIDTGINEEAARAFCESIQ